MPSHRNSSSSSKENPRQSGSRTKASHSTRAPLQDHNRDASESSPGSKDDAVRIRELEELLCETQSQLRTTESRLQDAGNTEKQPPVRRNEAQNGPIDVPSRLSDVTMREIRTHLRYDKSEWRALRSCVRDSLRAARLNWSLDWKSQSTTKLGYAYNAIEDDFPELRRFTGQWAVNRISKDVWDNRKTYLNCVDKPSTYIGRRAARRHGAGGSSTTRSSSPLPSRAHSPQNPSPPRSHSGSPSPGPSRPRLYHRRKVLSSSSDSGDDLVQFSNDMQHKDDDDDDDEQEEEEDPSGKGKKRAKSSGGSAPKRAKH